MDDKKKVADLTIKSATFSFCKYHKNSLLTILPRNRPKLWALNARSYGQQTSNTWAIDAHHVGSECPPNGHRQTNQWADFQEISAATSNDINMTFPDFS